MNPVAWLDAFQSFVRARRCLRKKARKQVANALRDRRLVQDRWCQLCRTFGRTEAHHQFYLQPLAVQWLCRRCHRHVHAQPVSIVAEFLREVGA